MIYIEQENKQWGTTTTSKTLDDKYSRNPDFIEKIRTFTDWVVYFIFWIECASLSKKETKAFYKIKTCHLAIKSINFALELNVMLHNFLQQHLSKHLMAAINGKKQALRYGKSARKPLLTTIIWEMGIDNLISIHIQLYTKT